MRYQVSTKMLFPEKGEHIQWLCETNFDSTGYPGLLLSLWQLGKQML